jgi:PTH1 family peptidyl-tRNA hydrolase
MRILFGIGNPGPEYEGTRHNLGFEVLASVAGSARFTSLAGLPAEAARVDGFGDPLLVVRPLTYVNRCGPVLSALMRLTGTGRGDALVVVDDLDLAPGRVRLRERGSAGGHNGLRSIEAALGSDAYPRLRLGIGGPGAAARPDYVLARFPEDERAAVDAAVERSGAGVGMWLADGLEKAMAWTNRRDLDPGLDRP